MSREIKFRAWSDKLGMSKPFTLKGAVNSDIDEFDVYMQCTGLHDKNSAEIYEGDIVRDSEDKMCIVKFGLHVLGCCGCCYDGHQSVGFYLDPHNDRWDLGPTAQDKEWDSAGLEVIGNIYETAELLKEAD